MGLRTWVKHQLGMAPASASVDLLQATIQELPAPRRLGLDLKVPVQAWSTARLTLLFREAALQPSVTSLQAARVARHRLSLFWLTAPVDQLEALYASDLGELQRAQLAGPLVHQPLAIDEKQWRDQLLALVTAPAERFRLVNLLLALLPYTRPGQFQIERATDLLPDWFVRDYADHCDPQLKDQLDGPAGLLNPAEPFEDEGTPSAGGALPVVSERRGQDVINLVTSADEQRRIKALITLYGLAPDDAETLQELSDLRRIVAQVWLDVEPSQLETLNNGPLGEITWSLIRSGFGAEIVNEKDQQARQQLKALADTIYRPERHGLLPATLLFVRLEGTKIERIGELPQWLIDALSSLQ